MLFYIKMRKKSPFIRQIYYNVLCGRNRTKIQNQILQPEIQARASALEGIVGGNCCERTKAFRGHRILIPSKDFDDQNLLISQLKKMFIFFISFSIFTKNLLKLPALWRQHRKHMNISACFLSCG
jgi:hypothetical protein